MRVLFLLFYASIYSPFPTKTCQISCKTKIFCTFLLIYLHIPKFFRIFATQIIVRIHIRYAHIRKRAQDAHSTKRQRNAQYATTKTTNWRTIVLETAEREETLRG